MRDERLVKLARLLVDYSVGAGEGEQVVVSGGVAAEPLIKEVYARLLEVGAIPIPQVSLPGMQELFFGHAKEIHYEKTPPRRARPLRGRRRLYLDYGLAKYPSPGGGRSSKAAGFE